MCYVFTVRRRQKSNILGKMGSMWLLVLGVALAPHGGSAWRQYIDLTHTLKNGTTGFPGTYLTILENYAGSRGPLEWVASNSLEMSEHIGTHVDSPYHFSKFGWKVDEIPFDRLHGPAVIINIESRAAMDRNAMVLESDLMNWEERNGRIPDGAFVLMNSGWQQYFGDPMKALGTINDRSKMSFPGFSEGAAKWLVENRPTISAIGTDTVSCDPGNAMTVPVHVLLLGKNILCLEDVANLDKLPQVGAKVFAMAMKLQGTAAPMRMYGIIGDDRDFPISSRAAPPALHSLCALLLMIAMSLMITM